MPNSRPPASFALADRLGVPVKFVPFKTPGELADAAVEDVWDIGNIGAEPERAKTIAFTAAYVEIETEIADYSRVIPSESVLPGTEEQRADCRRGSTPESDPS